MEGDPATEVLERLAITVAPRCEVRAVELEDEPRAVDLVVLHLHRLGEREEVRLIAGIVLVVQE
ncbi:hypothetical protein ABN028_27940 [Actinopolymorpha sp. B17G11]|uniref:hypothetical protein n=1 Tax=Actinopolymorpha sp. B17G11 TaxID=3160861 RepID=UPI0032E3AA65